MKLVANGPGIGDGVALTGVVHAYRAARPSEPIDVVVAHPALWDHNPDVTSVDLWLPQVHGGQRTFPQLDGDGMRQCAGQHITQWMARTLGVEPPPLRAVRPYVYLTPAERRLTAGLDRYVTINAESAQWTVNRDWPLARWAQLVYALRTAGIFTIQIGSIKDSVLACDTDFRGEPLRAVAALLAGAACHVSGITGSMWLSAAVQGRAVIVWSGREDPTVIAHPGHRIVLYRPPMGCAPCWAVAPCPHGRAVDFTWHKPCLDGVEVSEVAAAVLAVVAEATAA